MRMSKIVRVAADLMYPFILIFGLYIVAHGHLTPGGGFQGGAVIATGTIFVIIAYGYREITGQIRKEPMRIRESIGLVAFIGAALLALVVGGTFFYNWLAGTGLLFGMPVPFGPNPGELNTGGVIPIMNIAVGLEVWGGLSLIVLYMLSSIHPEEES
jgi:energy-converting hydrogenase B subunit I